MATEAISHPVGVDHDGNGIRQSPEGQWYNSGAPLTYDELVEVYWRLRNWIEGVGECREANETMDYVVNNIDEVLPDD